MSRSDLCDFCLCVCLAEPHVGSVILIYCCPFLPRGIRPSHSLRLILSARAVKQTHACTLPYARCVSHRSEGVCEKGGGVSNCQTLVSLGVGMGLGNINDRGCMGYCTKTHAVH